ncbi:Isochorismatase hydrolase [Decorospora gaudefroyi]|uniref:Isochorismatase hydrolase n=1 Tax=Decorospora gaudefroyi TaxID=184978 RepID=A0A6A5K722_9PLEO|nr:Isochorismatase hydrolase [Decorospora gaudefroyi]
MKTALLIIDMQNFFLPMTTDAFPKIIKLSNHFRDKGWPQYFTQHGHPPSDFKQPVTNQLVRKWGPENSIHVNTPDWELIPKVQDLMQQGNSVKELIPKNTYDGFEGTNLEEKLRKEGVQRVVIVGVMTDCCCDTTGRSAFCKGFETWLVSDATGSANKTQHEAGLKAWGFGFGDVIKTEEVLRRLG